MATTKQDFVPTISAVIQDLLANVASFGAKPTAIRMSVETFEHFKMEMQVQGAETEEGYYRGLPIYFDGNLKTGEVSMSIEAVTVPHLGAYPKRIK